MEPNELREWAGSSKLPVYRQDAVNNCAAAAAAPIRLAKFKKQMYLVEGAQVMIRVNMWTEAGVVNGSTGIVRDIVVSANGERCVALVEVPNYTGPVLDPENRKLVPVRMVQHDWTQGRGKRKTVCTRQQLPLDLAWAISIHKSQGMTVGPEEAFHKLIVDCGPTEHWAPGLLYVAASRGVHRDCLAFDPVEINELGEITHMPFYNFNRFEKLNTSAGAELMFAYFERLKLKQP